MGELRTLEPKLTGGRLLSAMSKSVHLPPSRGVRALNGMDQPAAIAAMRAVVTAAGTSDPLSTTFSASVAAASANVS